ncbi:MAG: M28 family peptidase [Acidobacteria bacterium]|nr:M28 family peptidase [Acidobacteriota bacterium]
MKRVFCSLLLLLAVTATAADRPLSPEQYLAHVKYLASDRLKGRGNNQPELEQAAAYVERILRGAGVKAFPSLKGYRQFFEITAEIQVGGASRLRIGGRDYRLDRDFSLLSFSDQQTGHAEAVYCGYGIASADAGYDDYKGRNVAGKVAVVLDGSPDVAGVRERVTPHADLMSKLMVAKRHGAAAVILVREPRKSLSKAAERMGIPAFAVSPDVVSEMWGVPTQQLSDPHASFAPVSVSWDLRVEEKRKKVSNVVGYVAPRGKPTEWIVVGAHYDHLGLGEKFALDPSAVGQPHPGADDNASGTAGLLSLAGVIAGETSRLHRGIILVAFAGEELGLLGSAYFVNNLPPEVQRVVAMINMDMIGRARGKVYVNGVGSAREFDELVKGLSAPLKVEQPLQIETSQSSMAGSDHISFTQHGIPSLFFFSGLHGDYHKATDEWHKIDSASAVQVLELVRQAVDKLATSASVLHFVQVVEPRPSGGGSGYGAYFGSVPDFAQEGPGVRFADVRAGSPADKAGMRAGDVLVTFDGQTIENLYDFTFALRRHAPGQAVEVEYVRGGQTAKAVVTLEKRE